MNREFVARAALRFFPANARVECGEEMLGTLLDANATSSNARFVLELLGIVRSGMRARAAATAQAGPLRVVADGFCLGAVGWLTLFLAAEVGNRIRGYDPYGPWNPLAPWSLALLAAALALALIGYDRLAGSAALLFAATLVVDPSWHDLADSRRELMLVPVTCFLALVLIPRKRKPDYRRLAWLTLTATLALTSSITDDPTAAILILSLLVLAPLALALLPTDPRLAIALSLPATAIGIRIAQDPGGPGIAGILFLSAAPLVLVIATIRTRHRQTQTPI